MALTIHKQIAAVLQKVVTERCLAKAEALETVASPIRSLHLRNLNLHPSDVKAIANCLNQEKEGNTSLLTPISFSYNTFY